MKYFWPIKSLTFYAGLLCLVAVFTIFASHSFAPKSSCQIDFVIKTPVPVDFAIYYDIGEGLTQNDFQEKTIEIINQKTTVGFCIAAYNQLRTVRFDPAMRPVKMDIYSITLTYDDDTVYKVPFDSIKPGEQILTHRWDNTSFSFESVPDANDPNFSLTTLHDGNIKPDDTLKKILHYGMWIISAILIAFISRFFVIFFILGL